MSDGVRCIDASVAVKLVLKGEAHRAAARKLLNDSIRAGIKLIAPPIFSAEVDSVIRRRVHDGLLNAAKAKPAQALLDRAPVQIRTHAELRRRAREIAERFNQRTVYDATYAALADLFGAEFWTADKVFYQAVHRELKFVRYLSDYTRKARRAKGKRGPLS
jgi:predicted nucleic acid-binding protein